jgi:hypothetical protein
MISAPPTEPTAASARRRRAALVELDGSHAETLHSHATLLDRLGFEVHMLLRGETRALVGDPGPVAAVETFDVDPSLWRSIAGIRRLCAWLERERIDLVMLNTAEGRRVRNLCLLAPATARFVGVLHNAHKLGTSATQFWITRRVAGYFVLSETIAASVSGRSRPVEAFYPIYFPPFPPLPPGTGFEVVVPGRIDPKRRDYRSLVDELHAGSLHPAVRIVLLGDGSGAAGREVRGQLLETGAPVEIAAGFVPERELLQRTARARVVLPLITPRCPGFERYRTTKITGAWSLAFGLAKPMLTHGSLAGLDEVRAASILYEDGTLVARLNELAAAPDLLATVEARIASWPAFSIAEQSRRYATLVG